jgi:hypothetical protein
MFYSDRVGQLSFYSAEASPPRVIDLAGVLCGPGQTVGFGGGTAARLSAVLADRWRAVALAAACADRGVHAEIGVTDEGHPLMRTAFRVDLVELATRWTRGAVKSAPERFTLDGVTLRLWALAAGRWSESRYLFGLDPHNPQTHQPLADALTRAGVPVALLGVRGGGPALRVSGSRRLARLVELVGEAPRGIPAHDWPAIASRRGRASIGA